MYSTPHGSRISYPYRHYKNSMKNWSQVNIQYMVLPVSVSYFHPRKKPRITGTLYTTIQENYMQHLTKWACFLKNYEESQIWIQAGISQKNGQFFILQAVKDLFSDTCVSTMGLVENPINVEVPLISVPQKLPERFKLYYTGCAKCQDTMMHQAYGPKCYETYQKISFCSEMYRLDV
jgi:hypothetical protein